MSDLENQQLYIKIVSKVDSLNTHLRGYRNNTRDIFDLPGEHTVVRRRGINGEFSQETYKHELEKLNNLYDEIIQIMESKITEGENEDEKENEDEDDNREERRIDVLRSLKQERDKYNIMPRMNITQQRAKTREEIAEEHKYDHWWLGGKRRKTKSRKMKRRKTKRRKTRRRKTKK